MRKLIQNVKEELKGIGEQGLNTSNLETASKLVDILKDLYEAEHYEKEGDMMRDDYRDGGRWRDRDEGYGGKRYWIESEDYGRRGGGGRGSYRGDRMYDHLNRIMDGMEMYDYGRERYAAGGSEDRMLEGLEKMMYGVCSFVESAMDFAESAQEKEVIRKHVQKLAKL